MKYKLHEIVQRKIGNIDRFTTDLKYYVGGEHYVSSSIGIYDKGIIEGSTIGFKFHYPFETGDILFMSRNPHLRKCGMVMFSGLCSDSSYVLRTKDETVLLQKYLAILLQTDDFWNFVEKNKSGSVNYLLNWKTLREYEFELPPIEEQKKISDVLWAAENLRITYDKSVLKISELLKSEFQNNFESDKFDKVTLDSISDKWGKGQGFKKEDIIDDGIYSCIHYGELFTKYGPVIDKIKSKTNINPITISKKGDILFPASDVTPDGLSRCSVVMLDNILLGGDIIFMRPKNGINPIYLSYAINYQKSQLLSRITGSAIKHISSKKLESVLIPLPPIDAQNEFETFARKCNNLLFDVENAAKSINEYIKKTINNCFWR